MEYTSSVQQGVHEQCATRSTRAVCDKGYTSSVRQGVHEQCVTRSTQAVSSLVHEQCCHHCMTSVVMNEVRAVLSSVHEQCCNECDARDVKADFRKERGFLFDTSGPRVVVPWVCMSEMVRDAPFYARGGTGAH